MLLHTFEKYFAWLLKNSWRVVSSRVSIHSFDDCAPSTGSTGSTGTSGPGLGVGFGVGGVGFGFGGSGPGGGHGFVLPFSPGRSIQGLGLGTGPLGSDGSDGSFTPGITSGIGLR